MSDAPSLFGDADTLSPPLYDVIVADPPWAFASNSTARPGRNARRHYSCMSDAELMQMDIPPPPHAVLFVWVTAPIQWRAAPVIRAWGFEPVSELVWVKSRIGTGFWVRNRHELVWICRRPGTTCPRPAPFPDSVIEAPSREHSRKPEVLQDWIDEVWPDTRKLEMFARRRRPGWDAHGSEVDRFTEAAFGNGRTYTPQKTVDFERQLAWLARRELSGPIHGPVRVTIHATFAPPPSWSQKKRQTLLHRFHVQRPDLDNIEKAVLDGLNGVAFFDDAQVAILNSTKVWGEEARTVITVEALP